MFKCQVLGRMSKPGEKLNRLVVKSREQSYTQKVWEEGELVEIEVGKGWEIVKEINASDEGVKVWNTMTPLQKEQLIKNL